MTPMEEGFIKSEAQERTLLQSLNDLIIVHDENDCYVEAFTGNPDILFTDPAKYIGFHILEVLPASISHKYLSHGQKVRQTGLDEQLDYPLEIDGKTRWFSASMSLHENKQHVIVAVRDITERHEIEDTLRRERRIFRELAETFIESKDVAEISERFVSNVAKRDYVDCSIVS